MKMLFIWLLSGMLPVAVTAQVTKVSLQASGLTCSMCSKAVYNALEKVAFVEKVEVNIKTQEYTMSFKSSDAIVLDALVKAVEDAGFSVAGFKVTASVNPVTLRQDEHIKIGNQYFHFLNAGGKKLNGETTFTVVDKSFTSTKNFKKYSALSKKECVQTGRTAICCAEENVPDQTRVYHAII
jgi:copper chaperone CopZ